MYVAMISGLQHAHAPVLPAPGLDRVPANAFPMILLLPCSSAAAAARSLLGSASLPALHHKCVSCLIPLDRHPNLVDVYAASLVSICLK
jgi:hypothetical protein